MTLLVRVGEVTEFPPQRPRTPYRLDWSLTPPGAKRLGNQMFTEVRQYATRAARRRLLQGHERHSGETFIRM